MNAKQFLYNTRLTVLSFASALVINFTACSGDDEPSIDDVLSEETTPIDFEMRGFSYYYGSENYLFDYAGNIYVGSDTISKSKCTLNLRQGKHHLVWINGIDYWYSLQGKDYGLHYNPVDKTITTNNQYPFLDSRDIMYYEKDIEVTSYLMPTQQIDYTNYVVCRLLIRVTDKIKGTLRPEQNSTGKYLYAEHIGKLTGIPGVRTVSLTGIRYELDNNDWPIGIFAHFNSLSSGKQLIQGQLEASADSIPILQLLCPLNGLNDIQVKTEVQDANGTPISTTILPKFSLRRGYTTVLRGPLFSGNTSDWAVTMEPFSK